MRHPVVLSLFDDPERAARTARALRELGVPRERVSIVARSHDEEGDLARRCHASPGAEFEDSRGAGRLGELSAHLLAAIALVMPGIGPIVADGPLAAGLGEAAGHLAGDIGRMLRKAGMPEGESEAWESRIEAGAVLLGAHATDANVQTVRGIVQQNGPVETALGEWE
jgi:hypothetical protein